MFQMIAQAGGMPLMRIPWNTGENVKRALDLGAWGIVFPMTNSAAEAAAAVAAAKYPPRGFRSVGGSLAAMAFDTDASTTTRVPRRDLVIIQMGIRAVEHADDRVPRIDALLMGHRPAPRWAEAQRRARSDVRRRSATSDRRARHRVAGDSRLQPGGGRSGSGRVPLHGRDRRAIHDQRRQAHCR
jgi:hypothetical protein